MEISQDPKVGVYQSSDQFWSRVEANFNKGRNANWEDRSLRSLQARVQTIEKAIKTLIACIKSVESMRQSGSSNEDIMMQAKVLAMEKPRYKSGWKFDHVWGIMKNFEKFKDCGKSSKLPYFGNPSSESENTASDVQVSPGISCSPLNLDDDHNVSDVFLSKRPIGIKKAKLKRKQDEGTSSIVNIMEEGNKQLIDELQKTSAQLQQHLERTYAHKEAKEENKIVYRDLSSIQDPQVRAMVEAEKTRIITKRAQEGNKSVPFATGAFDGYFNNLGGSGSGLPDY